MLFPCRGQTRSLRRRRPPTSLGSRNAGQQLSACSHETQRLCSYFTALWLCWTRGVKQWRCSPLVHFATLCLSVLCPGGKHPVHNVTHFCYFWNSCMWDKETNKQTKKNLIKSHNPLPWKGWSTDGFSFPWNFVILSGLCSWTKNSVQFIFIYFCFINPDFFPQSSDVQFWGENSELTYVRILYKNKLFNFSFSPAVILFSTMLTGSFYGN